MAYKTQSRLPSAKSGKSEDDLFKPWRASARRLTATTCAGQLLAEGLPDGLSTYSRLRSADGRRRFAASFSGRVSPPARRGRVAAHLLLWPLARIAAAGGPRLD